MPSGGARTRSGPPPDPNALHREQDQGEWVTLPAEGRKGRAPTWPLDGGPTTRERQLWRRLWALPQAVMWERQVQFLEVALYVRRLAEAEAQGSSVNLSTLVRQMSDSLGLTTPGLRSNRWKIERLPEASVENRPQVASARDRLKVVSGDGGA